MKFWYVCVIEKYKLIMQKQCLSTKDANTLFKEMREKYPAPQYQVTKEFF